MSLLKILGEKGWENQKAPPYQAGGDSFAVPPHKVALFFFLGVASVLFALFITAYFIRMELTDWRPMPESPRLWLNTGILVLASVVLQWTLTMTARERLDKVKLGILAGGVLTFAFVLGQLGVWRQMAAAGYVMYNNPANAFFYVITGIHALHILGGLWVWTRAGIRALSGAKADDLYLSVELCTVYWHFLLLVWLVIFALLSYT